MNTADDRREIERERKTAMEKEKGKRIPAYVIAIGFVFACAFLTRCEHVIGVHFSNGFLPTVIIIALIVGVALEIYNRCKIKKVGDQAEQYAIEKQIRRDYNLNQMMERAHREGFVFSKIAYNTTRTACVAIDTEHKEFLIRDDSTTNILSYKLLLSYELCKDGNTVVSGDAVKPFVGGLFFGTIGAIAGASGTTRAIDSYCSELYVSIVDAEAHRYRLYLITESTPEASADYKNAMECARDIMTLLNVIEASNAEERAKAKPVQEEISGEGGVKASEADEIRKFKELADSGIITQEEFEAKKKQLLGL